jgi:hypothetical protein
VVLSSSMTGVRGRLQIDGSIGDGIVQRLDNLSDLLASNTEHGI